MDWEWGGVSTAGPGLGVRCKLGCLCARHSSSGSQGAVLPGKSDVVAACGASKPASLVVPELREPDYPGIHFFLCSDQLQQSLVCHEGLRYPDNEASFYRWGDRVPERGGESPGSPRFR